MKKIITLLTIALFTINSNAQQATAAKQEKSKKEACSMSHDGASKKMTAEEVATCKAKCKAEGKKCDAKATKKEDKKCCAKKA